MRRWLRAPAETDLPLRAAGDAARDARDWSLAADHYRAYLAAAPTDAAIWVQYGHVSKEGGALEHAEQAYRRAIRLMPDDADARLHLAHLLKTMERPDEASTFFTQLFSQSPTAETLREILRTMERPSEASTFFTDLFSQPPTAEILREVKLGGNGYQVRHALELRPHGVAGNGVFIELKDLLQYLSSHMTVTGITRVTLGLVNYVLYEMDEDAARSYHFVQQYGDGEGVILIGKEHLRRIVRAAMHDAPDLEAMQALIEEVRTKSPIFRLSAGDAYLIVGAFWEFVANPSWLGGMRSRGVVVGTYIYDLIPITHAQYCMKELTTAFTIAFAETARLLNFALTISAFVADDVRTYLDSHGLPVFPIVPVPLAHELRFQDRSGNVIQGTRKPPERRYLSGMPFVLCVCTIEARKNHEYLFAIWQKMLDERVPIPDLVFVGRPGWRVEDLIKDLELSEYLHGRLHVLNGLSDEELNDLYERCSFTVFPSFVEGWGLPVGESLAHGKVCVASSTSSIPEVGGAHTIYIDPFDVDQGYEIISGLVREPARIAALEREIEATFRARTWNDVGRDFFAHVDRLVREQRPLAADQRLFAPRIAPAAMLDVAKLGRLVGKGSAYVSNPQRLLFAKGWRTIEATGTWMLDAEAELRIQTDCEPSEQVSAVLHVGTSPWITYQNVLGISADPAGVSYRRPMQKDADFWVTIEGRVDDTAVLTISFSLAGTITTPGGAIEPMGVRVHSAGYAPVADPAGRIKLLEGALTSKA